MSRFALFASACFLLFASQASAQVHTVYNAPVVTDYGYGAVYSPPASYYSPRVAYYAPATPVVTYAQPQVVRYAPAQSHCLHHRAPAVTTYYAPALTVTYYAPAPTVTYYAPAPTTVYYGRRLARRAVYYPAPVVVAPY